MALCKVEFQVTARRGCIVIHILGGFKGETRVLYAFPNETIPGTGGNAWHSQDERSSAILYTRSLFITVIQSVGEILLLARTVNTTAPPCPTLYTSSLSSCHRQWAGFLRPNPPPTSQLQKPLLPLLAD